MKKILIATIILCFSLSPIHAEDYETTHTFAAGDILSADMMNELFDYIKKSQEKITDSSILGTWSCSASTQVAFGTCSSLGGTDSLYHLFSGTITFNDDGDGTYSYTTGSTNVLRCNNNAAADTQSYSIKNNIMFTKITGGVLASIELEKISDTKLLLQNNFHSSSKPLFIDCDKQAIPPTNPTAFAIATTGLSNVLTWTDNSSDETGFKVYKKTSATGSWVLIDAGAGLTVNANIVTYTDTVSTGGYYWYRVKANNVNNGDSVGSKVIMTEN